MVELSVEIEQGSTQCLTYKHRESRLQGRMVVKTADKLKLRQLSVRLISTELVDFHTGNGKAAARSNSNGGNSGLHSYLQKSSRAVGTWVILERKPSASHVLLAGEHHYSFEIPLPKGLDGSVASKTYTLHYDLEGRLEHSFKLKPNTICLQPIELVQVPMALNLHADDRISLSVVPRLRGGGRTMAALMAEDVPIGKAVCVTPDAVDQKECFVLHHLWDGMLSFRLRLPHGRVLPVGSNPVLDIEAVPIARHHRFTRATIVLEEISIIARPQHAGTVRVRYKNQLTVDAEGASSSTANQESQTGRRASISASQLSSSSEDSLAANPSHNAWAYAQECSAEYRNAITRVREIGRVSVDWMSSQYASLAAYHGILAAKPNIQILPAADNAMHPDLRNSHIQVHHQLVYQLEYQVLSPDMISVVQQKEPRVRAAAHILGSLGRANIVRREELHTGGLATMSAGQTHLVRGTLPVAMVSAKIASLWAIRGLERDPLEEPSAVVAAIRSHTSELVTNTADTELQSSSSTHEASSLGLSTGIHRRSLVFTELANAVHEADSIQNDDGSSRSSLPDAPEPTIQSSELSGSCGSGSVTQDNREHPTEENLTESASVIPTPVLAQPPQSIEINGASTSYNPFMFQQQIEQFRAQQRQQQHQFLTQLAEQYASLVADGHSLLTSSLPRELEEHLSATTLILNTAAGHAPVSELENLHTSVASDSNSNISAHSNQEVRGTLQLLSLADVPDNHSNSVTSNLVTLPQANIRHSPPPSYDDLLPPAYDMDSRHPPPYRPARRR